MTTLQLIAPAPVGGAETVVLGLAKALAASGERTHVAALVFTADHPFLAAAAAAGVETEEVRGQPRRYWQHAGQVAEVARRLNADLVHTHGFLADVVGGMAAWRLGIGHVSTLHGYTGEGALMDLYGQVARFFQRRADAVVAVSQPIQARLVAGGIAERKVALIPNGAPTLETPLDRSAARAELGIHDTGPVVGWIGRVSHEKGPDILLGAIARITRGNLSFSIIGDGPMRAALEAQARTEGLSQVHWHGMRSHAARLIRAFDAVVLSSRSEGTPMILLEAAAAGVPIIATAVGGVPQLLTDAEAVLVTPTDATALARAIEETLAAPETMQARASLAQVRVAELYSAPRWAERHRALYDMVRAARTR